MEMACICQVLLKGSLRKVEVMNWKILLALEPGARSKQAPKFRTVGMDHLPEKKYKGGKELKSKLQ